MRNEPSQTELYDYVKENGVPPNTIQYFVPSPTAPALENFASEMLEALKVADIALSKGVSKQDRLDAIEMVRAAMKNARAALRARDAQDDDTAHLLHEQLDQTESNRRLFLGNSQS